MVQNKKLVEVAREINLEQKIKNPEEIVRLEIHLDMKNDKAFVEEVARCTGDVTPEFKEIKEEKQKLQSEKPKGFFNNLFSKIKGYFTSTNPNKGKDQLNANSSQKQQNQIQTLTIDKLEPIDNNKINIQEEQSKKEKQQNPANLENLQKSQIQIQI